MYFGRLRTVSTRWFARKMHRLPHEWGLEQTTFGGGDVTAVSRVLGVFRKYRLRVLAVFPGPILSLRVLCKHFGRLCCRYCLYSGFFCTPHILPVLPVFGPSAHRSCSRYSPCFGCQCCKTLNTRSTKRNRYSHY